MENGFGYVKEYFSDGKVKMEGKYVNGVKHGFFEEYNIEYIEKEFQQSETVENREFYYLKFEGEYLKGKRNGKGKGKENNIQNKLKFKGEYLNGKRWNGIEYNHEEGLDYIREYKHGERWGKGKNDRM